MRNVAWIAWFGLAAHAGPAAAQPQENAMPLETLEIAVGPFVFDALAAGPESGDLVLLLHGFPQTSHAYRHQLGALGAKGFRAVAPDQRGYSPRARPTEAAAYGMSALVGDVLGIADALGRSRFHLVGHDWGGAVAWIVATRFPGRLLSLTVLSTPHVAAFGQALQDPNSEQAQRSSYMPVFAAAGTEHRLLADDAAALRAIFAGGDLSAEAVEIYVDALGTPDALRAALNWYTASALRIGAGPASPASPLPPISVPTLYVWSTNDIAFAREPAEATGEWVSAPYRFEVLDGISHWIPEQAADRVSAMLLEHLEANRAVRN